MNKKKLIIIGSLLVVVGIGGYFGYNLYTKNKKKKEEEANKESEKQNQGSGSTPAPSSAPAPAPPPPPAENKNVVKSQPTSNEVRFKVGEKVKTNKSVVVTPYRIVNNQFVRTGEANKTLSKETSLIIARAPFKLDGKVTYRLNPISWLGSDDNTFYTIYQEHLQIA